jgi:hypothetical protein
MIQRIQIFCLFLSIDVWVVGSITGIDYYKIDIINGLQYSVIVRDFVFFTSFRVDPLSTHLLRRRC